MLSRRFCRKVCDLIPLQTDLGLGFPKTGFLSL
jgi:hypothetical protein